MGTDRQTDGQTQVTTITLRPKRPRVKNLQSNINQNLYISIQENTFENFILKYVILYNDQCVNSLTPEEMWR